MPDCVVQEYTSVIMLRFLNSFFTKNSSSFKKSKSPALNLLPKKNRTLEICFSDYDSENDARKLNSLGSS